MAPPPVRSVAVSNDASLSAALTTWNALRQTDMLSFGSYARFLVAHPGWPGDAGLRKVAERALRADAEDPRARRRVLRALPTVDRDIGAAPGRSARHYRTT